MSKVIQLKIDRLKKYGTSRGELKKILIPIVQWMSDHKAEYVSVEIPNTEDGIANVITTVRVKASNVI